jgi:hypothetical protein
MTGKSFGNFASIAIVCICITGFFIDISFAQTDCTGWGNITGIRVEGQKMEFGTSLRVAAPDWSSFAMTANEQVRPRFVGDGNTLTIAASGLGNMNFTEVIEDTGPGIAKVTVQFSSRGAVEMAGAFFCIELPGEYYSGGSAELINPSSSGTSSATLRPVQQDGQNDYLKATAGEIRLISPKCQLQVTFDTPTEIIVKDNRREGNTDFLVYLAVISGNSFANQTSQKIFTIKATGEIDTEPVTLTLDASKPGRSFDGIGGNFRLQNANADPPVIQYNLENLRVSWARCQMPWSLWHRIEDVNPIEAAKSGRLNQSVREAMEMAQTLGKRGIPVILSTWSAPNWAIRGGSGGRRGFGGFGAQEPGGLRGSPLNPEKMDEICDSISDYVLYLKDNYDVEAALYSFNESDLGINIRQTGAEHALLIKKLGAAFASKGLATKMLLGDTSDAFAIDFIEPAINDPETHKYIGAISFHSWRGGSDELFARWGQAASKLNVPIMVGEGSIDPAAHQYPAIFVEPSFALSEIDLYIRICKQCQPVSILQWQLTSDYSILSGGRSSRLGGPIEPLQPTERFWSLKQLGSTKKGSSWLPIACDGPFISSAAFCDIANGKYAVHLVNNGTTRQTTLTGLPENIKGLRKYITNGNSGMKDSGTIPVSEGKAQFTLESASYISLFSE